MRETIAAYNGHVLSINPEDFEAKLYHSEDKGIPIALGTFCKRLIPEQDLPHFLEGSWFVLEIYREDGNVKGRVILTDLPGIKNGSAIRFNTG